MSSIPNYSAMNDSLMEEGDKGFSFPTRKDFLASCQSQNYLSLPKPIIDYILKAPKSAKLYQKLIQCCKLFFVKNPILVIRALDFGFENGGWQYCVKDKCDFGCQYRHKTLDMENLKSKIWITGKLAILDSFSWYEKNTVKELLQKLYRCDATHLYFVWLTIENVDLKLLSECVEDFYMKYGCVNDSNGKRLPLEDLMRIFPKVEQFVTRSVRNDYVIDYKKLVDACASIEHIGLYNLHDVFDIDTFAGLLQETNCPSTIYYMLESADSITTWEPVVEYESSDDEDYPEDYSENDEDYPNDIDINSDDDEDEDMIDNDY